MNHYVYRAFDSDGRCLYVGASTRYMSRIHDHAGQRAWGVDIDSVRVTVHPTSDAALMVERQEIHALSPLHNIAETDRSRLAPGQLKVLALDILREHGPMTQTEWERELADRGYHAGTQSAANVLLRLVTDGSVAIVGERPSRSGRWKTARVYAVAA